MVKLVFFEKPGCITNGRQKKLLTAAGIDYQVRNLLVEPWTAHRLREFFSSLPVQDWFNRNAPSVKDGTVDPESMNADQAIDAMLEDPLLIRRPLFEKGSVRWCGFNWEEIEQNLSLPTLADLPHPSEECSHTTTKDYCS